jgi:hypothetical protein
LTVNNSEDNITSAVLFYVLWELNGSDSHLNNY